MHFVTQQYHAESKMQVQHIKSGIQQCLHTKLGHNAEAYVDDVVIKT
jgi:hypothetical protein